MMLVLLSCCENLEKNPRAVQMMEAWLVKFLEGSQLSLNDSIRDVQYFELKKILCFWQTGAEELIVINNRSELIK